MIKTENRGVLLQEMEWLDQVIRQEIGIYLRQEGYEVDAPVLVPPIFTNVETPYTQFIIEQSLGYTGRLAIALSMAPHLKPEVLDIFFGKNRMYDKGFTEFGGLSSDQHSGFLPSLQTLYFLTMANRPEQYEELQELLNKDAFLIREGVLTLGSTDLFPANNALLSIGNSWLNYFLSGEKSETFSSAEFPAQQISTAMNWEDVVLPDPVLEQLEEMSAWLEHGTTLLTDWGLSKMIKPGYRALFYGPPGTGKTLTATLLGKSSEREVYKVDLSMIVSKYIGETEKNLAKVFDVAERKDWILFFDEADALFGKRTAANSSNDRFANQQTAYLLQRIEDYPGVVILASNLKANMDEAFSRRFQAMIHFPMPEVEERFQLWQNAFSMGCQLEDNVDLYELAESYELAGGSIINVLRYCALKAIKRNQKTVTKTDLHEGIRKEYQKENKTLSVKIS